LPSFQPLLGRQVNNLMVAPVSPQTLPLHVEKSRLIAEVPIGRLIQDN
jgi:hypothetical protein